MKSIAITSILLSILLTNCATILSGTKQKVVINSEPSYADVYINLENIGKTGEQLTIKKKDLNKLVTIKKDGYQDYKFEFNLIVNPIAWLDVPFAIFFLIPSYIDEVTKANIKTDKDTYSIQLTKK